MGAIFSRKKGKESFAELLASLTKDINTLECRQNHFHRQYRLLALYTFISLVLYVALLGGYVFYLGIPQNPAHWAVAIGSLLLIWILRWIFKWIVASRASSCESRLAELRGEKKEILGRVMDEVPYKTAKELLEKYDPQSPHLRQAQQQQQRQQRGQEASAASSSAEGVRQRRPDATAASATSATGPAGGRPLSHGVAVQQQQQLIQQQAMLQHQQQVIANQERRLRAQQEHFRQAAASGDGSLPAASAPVEPLPVYELKPGDVAGPAPGPPKPQPILPRDRSSVDKVVEFLVGDGPNNRYALVCKSCYSHNGMVLPSDFEYCTFRCAYCYELNPARKQMPVVHEASSSVAAKEEDASNPGNTDSGQGISTELAGSSAAVCPSPDVLSGASAPVDSAQALGLGESSAVADPTQVVGQVSAAADVDTADTGADQAGDGGYEADDHQGEADVPQ